MLPYSVLVGGRIHTPFLRELTDVDYSHCLLCTFTKLRHWCLSTSKNLALHWPRLVRHHTGHAVHPAFRIAILESAVRSGLAAHRRCLLCTYLAHSFRPQPYLLISLAHSDWWGTAIVGRRCLISFPPHADVFFATQCRTDSRAHLAW